MQKSFDEQGFLITGSALENAAAASSSPSICFGVGCGAAGNKIVGSTSKAGGGKESPRTWGSAAIVGFVAALLERLIL